MSELKTVKLRVKIPAQERIVTIEVTQDENVPYYERGCLDANIHPQDPTRYVTEPQGEHSGLDALKCTIERIEDYRLVSVGIYDAKVYVDRVEVGCQTFKRDTVKCLVDAIDDPLRDRFDKWTVEPKPGPGRLTNSIGSDCKAEIERKLNDGREVNKNATSIATGLAFGRQPEGYTFWAMANRIYDLRREENPLVTTLEGHHFRVGKRTVRLGDNRASHFAVRAVWRAMQELG